jgi:hypothetical protein
MLALMRDNCLIGRLILFFLYVLWASQMQVGEGELHSEKRHPDYRNEPPNPRLKKSKNNKVSFYGRFGFI